MGVPQSRPPAVKLSDVVVRLVVLYSRVGACTNFAVDTECPLGVGHFGVVVPYVAA